MERLHSELTLHLCYAILLCMAGNFTQGDKFHHGAKQLAEILSRSRLTQSNKTYLTVAILVRKWISTYVTPVEKQCTRYLPAVSTRSPGACESNSAPGPAQAKLISHSTAELVKNSTEKAGMGTGRSKNKHTHVQNVCVSV